ncbi:MAG TPA: MoaD/ThiS family protein [Bacteroidetes bacterium]|nr:MoaD/ThiS family protein [Bacteroidota bacterium]
MNILLNDTTIEIPDDYCLKDLLKLKGYRRAAVIINDKHILIREYEKVILKNNDAVKIVRISGGG